LPGRPNSWEITRLPLNRPGDFRPPDKKRQSIFICPPLRKPLLFQGGFPAEEHSGGPDLKSQETVCSIVACDPKEDLFGIAVFSSAPAVGKTVPFTGAFAGAMAVQGFTSPYFGVEGMKLLRDGVSADKVIEKVLTEDPIRESRQLLALDRAGRPAAFTGSALPTFAGSVEGDRYIIGGCGLADGSLLEKAAKVFEEAQGDLVERLLTALGVAGDSNGNREGAVSAALRVSKDQPHPFMDLRVDKHGDPITMLSTLLAKWRMRNPPKPPPELPEPLSE
jgi:uncharacterized Ntn-hydrolase superfamily protein